MDKSFSQCLICSSSKLTDLPDYQKDHLSKCQGCGFVFSKRIPTEQELVEEYYKYERGFELSPITIKRYNELLDGFETYRQQNNILDVGAGDGHFIEVARKRGWNTYATEFDDKAVDVMKAKGINVVKGGLDIANYEAGMFDVIFWAEVIEHINNPIEELKKFNYLLRKNGIVYVTTPNFNALSHKYLGSKWTIFNYPEHLCYYTPKTIKSLFKNNGFKDIAIQTTGFGPDRFYASLGKSNNNISTEKVRQKTETKLFWKGIKYMSNKLFNLLGIGDALKGTFVKI